MMAGEVRKGWWKVSVSNRVYDRLERIKKELEREAGARVSYDQVMDRLVRNYRSGEKKNNG